MLDDPYPSNQTPSRSPVMVHLETSRASEDTISLNVLPVSQKQPKHSTICSSNLPFCNSYTLVQVSREEKP